MVKSLVFIFSYRQHAFLQNVSWAITDNLTYRIGRPGCSTNPLSSSDPSGAESAPVMEYVPVVNVGQCNRIPRMLGRNDQQPAGMPASDS